MFLDTWCILRWWAWGSKWRWKDLSRKISRWRFAWMLSFPSREIARIKNSRPQYLSTTTMSFGLWDTSLILTHGKCEEGWWGTSGVKCVSNEIRSFRLRSSTLSCIWSMISVTQQIIHAVKSKECRKYHYRLSRPGYFLRVFLGYEGTRETLEPNLKFLPIEPCSRQQGSDKNRCQVMQWSGSCQRLVRRQVLDWQPKGIWNRSWLDTHWWVIQTWYFLSDETRYCP